MRWGVRKGRGKGRREKMNEIFSGAGKGKKSRRLFFSGKKMKGNFFIFVWREREREKKKADGKVVKIEKGW